MTHFKPIMLNEPIWLQLKVKAHVETTFIVRKLKDVLIQSLNVMVWCSVMMVKMKRTMDLVCVTLSKSLKMKVSTNRNINKLYTGFLHSGNPAMHASFNLVWTWLCWHNQISLKSFWWCRFYVRKTERKYRRVGMLDRIIMTFESDLWISTVRCVISSYVLH